MPKDTSLLKRLMISEDDLLQAKKFINFVLEKELYNCKNEEDELILLAFSTAVIVSYSRPFKNNVAKSLLESFLDSLTENELKIHNRFIKMRDKEYAHSDAVSYSPEFYGDFLVTRNPFNPLEEKEFIALNKIIEKLLSEIITKRQSIK